MFRRFALALLALLPLCAQERLPMPQIRIQEGDRSVPARIHDLRIDVKVVGHVATTTWDMTIHNPQTRVLEGELVFPLGEGQTVSRFAMDVNGRLREGVVVEKAKGRRAFEEIVRRGVDPGLLEKTAGNSFKARVYPIPARGYKRVVLAYEQELADGGPGELLYRLPLAFTDKVATFGLKVEVLDQPVAPRATASPLANFSFKSVRRGYLAEEVRSDFLPDRPLVVSIPRASDSGQVFVERRDGQDFFFVMVHPGMAREAKPLPRRLLVVWDASASARNRDLARELGLLEAYLRRLGTCEVNPSVFRDAAEPLKAFRIQDGNAAGLIAHLKNLPLDGGTCLGAVKLKDLRVDETLLFSDGLGTFGPREAQFPEAPLVAVNSALTAEHGLLRALGEGQGGEYLNLQSLSAEEALKALTTRPLAFLRAVTGRGDVAEVYPGVGRVVRGPFGLAGLLKTPRARLTLQFGFGRSVRVTRTFDLDAAKAAEAAPVARMWAQRKLAKLELDPARNAKAILALGQAHGLVTEGTSLIVLDDVADYVRYRIAPPEELRAEYDRRVGEETQRVVQRDKEHLEALVKQFEERKAWWATEFKAPPKPRPSSTEPPPPGAGGVPGGVPGGVIGGVVGGVVGGTARREEVPPPPPPPPPGAGRTQRNRPPAQAVVEVVASVPVSDRTEVSTAANLSPGVTEGTEPVASGTIELKPWTPDTPYLKELKAAPAKDRYTLYLRQRETYGKTPGFFLDISDFFRDQGEKDLALRILSNLAELKLESAPLLRILGYRLRQLGMPDLAVWTFGEVLRIREEEPQSRRDLALALVEAGQPQKAVGLFWELVKTPWDGRFHDVNLIALGELNALLATSNTKLDASAIDPRLVANLPVDVRVVLNWDTDNSDMDLHVVDPRGEECYYSHNRTAIGGRISRDVTAGYGPEEFLLRRAFPGAYAVRARFYGTREQTAIGATTVTLELYLRYGTGRVENKSITLRLEGPGRTVDIGTFRFEGD